MRAVLPPARWIGPAVIAGLAGAWAVLWFAAEPPGQPAVAYLGQFFGAESVLLLSIGLVLISTLPWCEAAFDGIDRAAIWHRRVAITGMILLVPHILLSANPHRSSLGPLLGVIGAAGLLILAAWAILPRWRSVIPRAVHGPILAVRRLPGLGHLRRLMGGYELWRSVHRLTGLFVAAGFAHGLLDGTPFPHAQLLRWTFVAIGVTPFLSWLRALDAQPPRGPVDLFYTSAGPDMPYIDEITAAAAGCDLIRVHIIDSRAGHLTAAQVLASADGEQWDTLSVFMCGPAGMTRNFRTEFRRAGIPRRHVYREYFDWR